MRKCQGIQYVQNALYDSPPCNKNLPSFYQTVTPSSPRLTKLTPCVRALASKALAMSNDLVHGIDRVVAITVMGEGVLQSSDAGDDCRDELAELKRGG